MKHAHPYPPVTLDLSRFGQGFAQCEDLTRLTRSVGVAKDVPVTKALRACLLASQCPANSVLILDSALWVWTGDFHSAAIHRHRVTCAPAPGHSTKSQTHRMVLRSHDVQLVGDVYVTTLERTAVDLLTQWGLAEAVEGILDLAHHGLSWEAVVDDIGRRPRNRVVHAALIGQISASTDRLREAWSRSSGRRHTRLQFVAAPEAPAGDASDRPSQTRIATSPPAPSTY